MGLEVGRQAAREGVVGKGAQEGPLTTRAGAGWEGGRALAHPLTHSLHALRPVSTYAWA